MKELIFIAGAPGIGKSTVAHKLQKMLKSPCFEFGWIPEFRYKENQEIDYVEEEGIAFENLVLVIKNYLKHGFKNIIITDLEDKRIFEIDKHFSAVDYCIFTLTTSDSNLLKERVLDEGRTSGYRDWQKALEINDAILKRELLSNEIRIDNSNITIQLVLDEIKSQL